MSLLDLLHRWTGGLIGLVLAVLGLSGAALVHRDAWVNLPHAGDRQVQETQALAATVERLMADPHARPRSIVFATETFGLNRLSFGKEGGAYADQAGGVVARWDDKWERPEIWLFDLHHHLFAGDAGETAAGLAGLCGLFFVGSGVILWWRTRHSFRFRLFPARLARPAILRHHRDLGVVVAPILALSLMTGVIMVFRPMVAVILGPGAPALVDEALKPPPPRRAELAERLDWGGMILTARRLYPDSEVRILSLPRGETGLISLRLRRRAEWLPNGRTTLWFAADTGRLVAHRDALALPERVQAYNALYPLHAAKVGGLAWRLVMTVSGLSLGVLGTLAVWTFWFARKPAARRAIQAPSPG